MENPAFLKFGSSLFQECKSRSKCLHDARSQIGLDFELRLLLSSLPLVDI